MEHTRTRTNNTNTVFTNTNTSPAPFGVYLEKGGFFAVFDTLEALASASYSIDASTNGGDLWQVALNGLDPYGSSCLNIRSIVQGGPTQYWVGEEFFDHDELGEEGKITTLAYYLEKTPWSYTTNGGIVFGWNGVHYWIYLGQSEEDILMSSLSLSCAGYGAGLLWVEANPYFYDMGNIVEWGFSWHAARAFEGALQGVKHARMIGGVVGEEVARYSYLSFCKTIMSLETINRLEKESFTNKDEDNEDDDDFVDDGFDDDADDDALLGASTIKKLQNTKLFDDDDDDDEDVAPSPTPKRSPFGHVPTSQR